VSPGVEKAIARAEAYLRAHAAPLDLVFLETLLRRREAGELLRELAARQDPRGALAPWRAGQPDARAATLTALAWLDALGLLDHAVPDAACAFLLGEQGDDGGFGAADGDARVDATGLVAGFLAKSRAVRASRLRAAEQYLARAWSVERVQGPTYAPILGYVHFLSCCESDRADEILQWCGRELERGFRTHAFAAVDVARVFLRARSRALPGAQIDAGEVALALVTAQRDDGAWPAAHATSEVDATLEAVEALLRLG
jgi:hypothetical protein